MNHVKHTIISMFYVLVLLHGLRYLFSFLMANMNVFFRLWSLQVPVLLNSEGRKRRSLGWEDLYKPYIKLLYDDDIRFPFHSLGLFIYCRCLLLGLPIHVGSSICWYTWRNKWWYKWIWWSSNKKFKSCWPCYQWGSCGDKVMHIWKG